MVARMTAKLPSSPTVKTSGQRIYVTSADGSRLRRLTYRGSADSLPVWSANGTEVAYVSDRDGNPEIYKVNANEGAPTDLTTTPGERKSDRLCAQ